MPSELDLEREGARLRAALHSAPVPPVNAHLGVAKAATRAHRKRSQRRSIMAVASAVLLVAAGAGAVRFALPGTADTSVSSQRGTASDLTTWPLRGSLSQNTGLVAAVKKLLPAEAQSSARLLYLGAEPGEGRSYGVALTGSAGTSSQPRLFLFAGDTSAATGFRLVGSASYDNAHASVDYVAFVVNDETASGAEWTTLAFALTAPGRSAAGGYFQSSLMEPPDIESSGRPSDDAVIVDHLSADSSYWNTHLVLNDSAEPAGKILALDRPAPRSAIITHDNQLTVAADTADHADQAPAAQVGDLIVRQGTVVGQLTAHASGSSWTYSRDIATTLNRNWKIYSDISNYPGKITSDGKTLTFVPTSPDISNGVNHVVASRTIDGQRVVLNIGQTNPADLTDLSLRTPDLIAGNAVIIVPAG